LRLQAFGRDGRSLPGSQLRTPRAPTTIRPGTASTIGLVFTLPNDVDPDDIGTIRMRWALTHTNGTRCVQFTDFQRVTDPEVYGYGARSYGLPSRRRNLNGSLTQLRSCSPFANSSPE
jgi:hypothetical protein